MTQAPGWCGDALFLRATLGALVAAVTVGMAACSMSGPPPVEYVLGPVATGTTVVQTDLPIVELKRVRLPDYLDTTDMLQRRGNQLIPSLTGRWGERLSVGITRALADSLAARLPRMVVTASPPLARPARQILVDVAAFEATQERHVLLVARWTIADGAGRQVLIAEQASLVEPIVGADDSAKVAAMSHALDTLAERLAAGIERDHPADLR